MNTRFEEIHWKFFNKLARVVGWCFFIGGLFGFLMTAIYILDPELFPDDANYSQSISGTSDQLISLVVPAVVSVFGVLLLKAKPYFPNKE